MNFTQGSDKGVRSNAPQTPLSPYEQDLYAHDAYLKTTIRVLRLIGRLIAFVIAIATGSQEALTLHTYITTHNIVRDGRGPWALSTSLWPSILLMTISILTIILSSLVMLGYIREGVSKANQINHIETYFSMAIEVGHVGIWVIVAVLYRVGKTGHDLWGWACSPLAEQIQPNFSGIVNFNDVCKRGNKSWELSIASAALQGLTALTLLLAFRRRRNKQRMEVAKLEATMREV